MLVCQRPKDGPLENALSWVAKASAENVDGVAGIAILGQLALHRLASEHIIHCMEVLGVAVWRKKANTQDQKRELER